MKYFYLILLSILVSCSGLELKAPVRPVRDFSAIWSRNIDAHYESGNLSITTAAPTIFEGILLSPSLKGTMTAHDVTSGRILWQVDDKQPLVAKPIVDDGLVYYGGQLGRFFVRDVYNGKLKYAINLGAPIESRVFLGAGRLLVHLRNHQLMALDQETGKILWSYTRSVPYLSTLQRVSTPLIYDNRVYVGFADGVVAKIRLEDGQIVWEQRLTNERKFVDVDIMPLVFNNYLVAGSANGPLSFLDMDTGVVMRTVNIKASHTPLIWGDKLVVGSVWGKVAVIDKEGGILVEKQLTDLAISDIKLWGETFLVTTMGDEIFSVRSNDLVINQSFYLGSDFSSVFGEIGVENDYFSIITSRSRLWVFSK